MQSVARKFHFSCSISIFSLKLIKTSIHIPSKYFLSEKFIFTSISNRWNVVQTSPVHLNSKTSIYSSSFSHRCHPGNRMSTYSTMPQTNVISSKWTKVCPIFYISPFVTSLITSSKEVGISREDVFWNCFHFNNCRVFESVFEELLFDSIVSFL